MHRLTLGCEQTERQRQEFNSVHEWNNDLVPLILHAALCLVLSEMTGVLSEMTFQINNVSLIIHWDNSHKLHEQ